MAKKAVPIASVFVQIKEHNWECLLWKTRQYEKIHGKDSRAISILDYRQIHLKNDEDFTIETIAHELLHAYWTHLHLDSVREMEVDDIEEIVASFMGGNLINFYSSTMFIYNELKGYVKK